MPPFQTGFATVDITPPPGLPLMGNARSDYAARGVHDPLHAKAVVFADAAGNKAAVLSVDLCMVDRDNVALIRRTIGDGCDVPPESVLVHATHTHSGPFPTNFLDFDVDLAPFRDQIEVFLRNAASAVVEANRHLAEARLSVGATTEDRLAFPRRLRRKDGSTQMNWEALAPGFRPEEIEAPWGRSDPEVSCLVVEQGGRPVSAVVNFGLHPAILAGDNWLYSADYPGYLAESLRRTRGEGFVSLFLNGCCGDVNHIDYRDPLQGRGFQMTQRVGYMLGAAACEAIRGRHAVEANRVAASSEQVTLGRIRIDDEERRRCARIVEEAAKEPAEGLVDGLPDVYFAETRLRMAAQQDQPDKVEVQVLRIGEVALVGLPGEIGRASCRERV